MDITEQLGQWYPLVEQLLESKHMKDIGDKIQIDSNSLQPPQNRIFRALKLTAPADVKVVILGQDPYPFGQADGLAFSSNKIPIPYSLQVIYQELEQEGYGMRMVPTLVDWADQGVLLLNTHLTTVYGHTEAHARIGWEQFTGFIIQQIALYSEDVVYMVWGSHARDMMEVSTGWRRYHEPLNNKLLYAPHPSAQQHGYNFLGCNHFRLCNEYLESNSIKPIEWTSELTLKM